VASWMGPLREAVGIVHPEAVGARRRCGYRRAVWVEQLHRSTLVRCATVAAIACRMKATTATAAAAASAALQQASLRAQPPLLASQLVLPTRHMSGPAAQADASMRRSAGMSGRRAHGFYLAHIPLFLPCSAAPLPFAGEPADALAEEGGSRAHAMVELAARQHNLFVVRAVALIGLDGLLVGAYLSSALGRRRFHSVDGRVRKAAWRPHAGWGRWRARRGSCQVVPRSCTCRSARPYLGRGTPARAKVASSQPPSPHQCPSAVVAHRAHPTSCRTGLPRACTFGAVALLVPAGRHTTQRWCRIARLSAFFCLPPSF